MKVFVAGATGVLGRRALRVLTAAGHEVTAVARSPERQAMVRALGATPLTVDLFDAAALRRHVEGHEAVCNLATHIPPVARMASAGAWRENDRIRFEASRNLADAALAGCATRFVQESIAFLYRSNGDRWIDESSPLDPVANLRSAAAAESQAARVTEAGGCGVVLRFAAFYGHDSEQTLAMIRLARKRIAAGVGPDAYVSSIITDDAASAVAAALAADAGVYNVGDDEPLTRRAFFAALADALGVRPPWIAPRALGRVGGARAGVLTRSQRVSNRRLRDATGWAPSFASVRDGWPAVVAELAATTS